MCAFAGWPARGTPSHRFLRGQITKGIMQSKSLVSGALACQDLESGKTPQPWPKCRGCIVKILPEQCRVQGGVCRVCTAGFRWLHPRHIHYYHCLSHRCAACVRMSSHVLAKCVAAGRERSPRLKSCELSMTLWDTNHPTTLSLTPRGLVQGFQGGQLGFRFPLEKSAPLAVMQSLECSDMRRATHRVFRH